MTDKLFEFKKLGNFAKNDFLIHRTEQNDEYVYKYGEIIRESKILSEYFDKIGVKKTRVSIHLPLMPQMFVILLSILNSESSFCPISQDAEENEAMDAVRRYGARFFISEVYLASSEDIAKIVGRRTIFGTDIFIYKILADRYESDEINRRNECYVIRTSGSTGIAKIVGVPYQCIAPNIKGLSDTLDVTSNDLIFVSSPITFDPFVVECFLALNIGAAILITDPKIRLMPYKLADVLQPINKRGVTIMQMTPSLFRLFSIKTIQEKIISNETSIRIILLGGEQFPSTHEISQWTVNNNQRTRIFNIYGITEVSCWSTLHELKHPLTDELIPIGTPIDSETEIRVVNEMNESISEGLGEIQIGSTSRKCTVNNENWMDINSNEMLFRSTGDLGYISEKTIFYRGRTSDIIKRYGNRVDMELIVQKIRGIEGVLSTCCVFNDENMRLICFIVKNNEKTKTAIQQDILRTLQNYEKPDDIEFVDQFPVTSHGKISKEQIMHSYESSKNNTPLEIFERFIYNVLCLKMGFKRSMKNTPKEKKVLLENSFLNAGGTSIHALTLSANIESVLKRPEPKLLEMMLNDSISISALFEFICKLNLNISKQLSSSECCDNLCKDMLTVKWQYDTGKCVDSTPRCFNDVVCVGSHSHLLIALDSKSGKEVSTCTLPDRIECPVSFVDRRQLLVGCYDGNVYSVEYSSGRIGWQYNCRGIIKAEILIKKNIAVIGNYSLNGNIKCIDLSTRSVLWQVQIGSKPIFASPLPIDTGSFVACTLSGETARVLFNDGQIVWATKFASPIFSTPAKWNDNSVLVAEVSGLIHCLNVDSGIELWAVKTEGNIFSSITVYCRHTEGFIIFGNHDHNVYCLKSTKLTTNPTISWKSALNSAVYSTPAILHLPSDVIAVISCSTKGVVYILDLFNGSKLFKINLESEIFSSPCVVENRIYIGCRNNNLVCLEIQYNNVKYKQKI